MPENSVTRANPQSTRIKMQMKPNAKVRLSWLPILSSAGSELHHVGKLAEPRAETHHAWALLELHGSDRGSVP